MMTVFLFLLCQRKKKAAQSFARAQIPEEILAALRGGQMTALEKPKRGICGIVVGDVIRRLQ